MRVRLPRLSAGDRLGLVAPAGPVPAALLEQAVGILRGWGLDVLLGEHVADVHPELDYLAGTDAERAADLLRVWSAPGVRAVWCLRGGYGCLRVADHLDLAAFREAGPRILLGSSDATLLHELLGAELDLATLFAPMPATAAFLDEPEVREHARRALLHPGPLVFHGEPAGPRSTVRGAVVGGNASVLASSIGAASHAAPPDGAIAFLEDVTESPYRLDRILTQLVRSGWFDRVAAIALGTFHDCGDPDAVRAAVASVLAPLGLPMLWNLPFGHGPGQHTVPLGTEAVLETHAGELHIEPALT